MMHIAKYILLISWGGILNMACNIDQIVPPLLSSKEIISSSSFMRERLSKINVPIDRKFRNLKELRVGVVCLGYHVQYFLVKLPMAI